MPERRKLKRRHLLYYLRVLNAETRRRVGYLVDITSEGVMLLRTQRMRPGRTIKMSMLLPGQSRNGERLEFDATSLWCRRDVNSDFWDVGFRVVNLNRRQMAVLETLIEDHGFND
ncbi:MAG TPA: PilZ domain-containing protein [Vicinamibacterales bacterium]|jgi:hypothetical protein